MQDNPPDRQEDSCRTNQTKGSDSPAAWRCVWEGGIGQGRMQLLSHWRGRGQAIPGKIHYGIIPKHGSYTCSSSWKPFGGHAHGMVEHRLLASRGGQVESDGPYHWQGEGGGRYLDRVPDRHPTSLPQTIYAQVSAATICGRERIQRTAPTPSRSMYRLWDMRLDLPREMHHDRTTGSAMVPAVLLWPVLLLSFLCNSRYTCYDEPVCLTHRPNTARRPGLNAHWALPASAQGPYPKLLRKTLQHQAVGSTFPA